MATTSKYNFDWLCRTCMQVLDEVTTFDAANTEPQQQQWQSIIDTIEECAPLQIAELISNTLKQIEVQLSDELPKKICRECVQSLVKAYRFQQTCLKSQQNLHTLIAKRNDELKMAISLATVGEEDGRGVNELVKQEPLTEAEKQGIEFEYVNAITATAVSQANNESIKDYINSVVELGEFVKIEPCDEPATINGPCDGDNDHTVDDDINSMDTVNNIKLITEIYETNECQDESTYNCSLCNKLFKNRRYLRDHLKRHQKKEEAKAIRKVNPKKYCSLCNREFKTRKYLKIHLKRHEEKTLETKVEASSVKCYICHKTYQHKKYLPRHLRWHQKIELLERKHYDNKFDQKLDEKEYKNEVKHVCNLCDQTFSSSFSLKRHKKLKHSGDYEPIKKVKKDNKLSCGICHQTVSTSFSLKRHIKAQHSKEKNMEKATKPTVFVCDFCKKIFPRHSALEHHVKFVHTTERPYECPKCQKCFKQQTTFEEHMTRHSEDKPHECPHCPLRFKCITDMHKHRKIHSELKRFICDICGKGFSMPHELKLHKLRHSGEKPYKCDVCDMRFLRKCSQQDHMRTHTGEKPFKCKYCERAYGQRGDFIKHLRTHVGDSVYRCTLCPLAFRLNSEMRLHFTTHKNEDPDTRERNLQALKEEEAAFQLKLAGKIN